MARKGRNIYKRKDGRWEGRMKNPIPQGGVKYLSFYGHSYHEVKEKMENCKQKQTLFKHSGNMTINQAIQIWLNDNKKNWKSSTYACYKQQIDKYILPELGEIKCRSMNNQVMSEFVKKYSQVSKSYMRGICGIITRCLKYINQLYDYDFKLPDLQFCNSQKELMEKFEAKQMPSEESIKILESYLSNHMEEDTCAGILLTMYTGIRIGELCALTWNDIDLQLGQIAVRNTMQRVKQFDEDGQTQIVVSIPKSISSMRKIPIPNYVLEKLKACNLDKTGYLIKGRKKSYAEPRTVQYRFQAILKKCNLISFNFHKLRHVFASACLQKGFDFKTLSELLGHANIQTTLNIYVHSSEERKRLLMENFKINVVA